MKNFVDKIIAYESGELGDLETLKLFAHLIKTGKCWNLQGHYGRTAQAIIDDNWINEKGKINSQKVEENCIS